MSTRALIHRMVIDDLEDDRLQLDWQAEDFTILSYGESPEDTLLAIADGSGTIVSFVGAEKVT